MGHGTLSHRYARLALLASGFSKVSQSLTLGKKSNIVCHLSIAIATNRRHNKSVETIGRKAKKEPLDLFKMVISID